ncbi:MAG: nucleoside triphosphate pyrophosphohydrolase, partial [Deltaproteobacteria bacterium]|nr:nucleoside triphosphate pyrophosphohydrolase [Deltaproteobacteria bacterium]
EQWHKIKKEEKNHTPKSSILDSVPSSLPALTRAYRISERAGRAGFYWEDISGVIEKVKEEWAEFNCELALQNKAEKNQESLALEFGDILFTLTNVARFTNIHPETALKDSVKKFEKRFKLMEKKISDNGRDIQSVSRNELDMLWEEAKKKSDLK